MAGPLDELQKVSNLNQKVKISSLVQQIWYRSITIRAKLMELIEALFDQNGVIV